MRDAVGPLPLLEAATEEEIANEEEDSEDFSFQKKRFGPQLNADGSYASQSASSESAPKSTAVAPAEKPSLRTLLVGGDFFLGAALANTVTKLARKFMEINGTYPLSVFCFLFLSVFDFLFCGFFSRVGFTGEQSGGCQNDVDADLCAAAWQQQAQ